MISLHWDDITLGSASHVHCIGKGRKERDNTYYKENSFGYEIMAE